MSFICSLFFLLRSQELVRVQVKELMDMLKMGVLWSGDKLEAARIRMSKPNQAVYLTPWKKDGFLLDGSWSNVSAPREHLFWRIKAIKDWLDGCERPSREGAGLSWGSLLTWIICFWVRNNHRKTMREPSGTVPLVEMKS